MAKHPGSHCIFLLLRPRPLPRSPTAFISEGEVNFMNIPAARVSPRLTGRNDVKGPYDIRETTAPTRRFKKQGLVSHASMGSFPRVG
jgi:hypothetical protein